MHFINVINIIKSKATQQAEMFDKLLGKKEKGIQVFNIPQKKYCHDSKKLGKMEKKDLVDVISDMEKYIGSLTEKLQSGKKQFERSQQRCQQIQEKSNVVNGQMSKISNEHEQLQVKFTNLQNSLQMMIQEREAQIREHAKFINDHAFSKQKIKDLSKVLEIYQAQVGISEKISLQNKQVKQKLIQLQDEYHQLSQKYNQIKNQHSLNLNVETVQLTNEDSIEKQKETPVQTGACAECLKYQSVIEGKDQIITSLNKQISAEREKLQQNSDKLEELNSDLQHILKKIQTKDQELTRSRQENAELNNVVTAYRRNENKTKQNQDRYKQELINLRNSVSSFEQQVLHLRQKLVPSEQLCRKMAQQSQKLKNEIEKKEMEVENVNQKLQSYEQEILSLSKLSSELKQKEMELFNLRNEIEKEKKKNDELKKSIQSLQEDYQIKLKKVEVTANQQRIKAEGLKRNLTILQGQEQQNKKNLDSMYEYKIQQDGKIVQMEKKLKEYKHSIQYLKKQKIELEKTFESKIKNMEEMVVENEQQDEIKPALFASKDLSCPSPSPRIQSTTEEFEKEAIVLHKRIAQLEQQVDMLKEQNMGIKLEKDQLESLNAELNANLKILTLKREEAMRQIKKMSSIKAIQNTQKISERKNSEQTRSREKKIAEKAYKGFDILAKLLATLYKEFLNVHISQIERKQIKQIENSINQIVRKSLDMKDIFQDYI